MVEVKRIKGGTDNCYLVTDGKNAILIDTASKPHINSVIEECDKYEMKLIGHELVLDFRKGRSADSCRHDSDAIPSRHEAAYKIVQWKRYVRG